MLIDHLIVEAQNYEQMFNDILKRNPNPQLRRQIAVSIGWARRTLRKNDRIVWFLRWMKLSLSPTTASPGVVGTTNSGVWQPPGAPGPGAMPQQYNRRFATAYAHGDVMPVPALKQRLEHFLQPARAGNPVPRLPGREPASGVRPIRPLRGRRGGSGPRRNSPSSRHRRSDEVLDRVYGWVCVVWLLPRGAVR